MHSKEKMKKVVLAVMMIKQGRPLQFVKKVTGLTWEDFKRYGL